MDPKGVLRKHKIEITANLVAAALLFTAGLFLAFLQVAVNSRAIIASAFVPLVMALSSWFKASMIRKYPRQMKPLILSENDERLAAARNRAEASSHAVLQWLLQLSFFCYTFIVPDDIFAAAGWWIVFSLFFVSVFGPVIALRLTSGTLPLSDD